MKETKKLTEGAILVGIYIIILLLTLYVPFIGLIIVWFLPLPYIIYVIRYGIKASLLVWFVTLLGTFLVGGIATLPFTVMFGSGGIVAGELYRRRKTAFAVLLGGSLVYIANLLIFFIISIAVFGIHPLHDSQAMLKESLDATSYMLNELGQDASKQLALYYDFVDQLPRLVSLFIVLMGVVYALISQIASSIVLKKLRFSISLFPPFRKWSFPKSFLWYYLIVLIIILVGTEYQSVETVTMNLFPLLEIVMAIQGLSFLFFYFYEKKLSKFFPIIITIVTLILPGALYLMRILGIIDLGFDLRNRVKRSNL